MYDERKVEEALELCRDIPVYYQTGAEKTSKTPAIRNENSFRLGKVRNKKVRNSGVYQLDDEEEGGTVIHSILKAVSSLILSIFIAYGAARMLTDFFIQPTVVEGISMEDTLHDGNILLLDKFSYRVGKAERFDIVVFPYTLKETFVKRIIGLPGETICIKKGKIYIDGDVLIENYGAEPIKNPGIAQEPILLGPDEYFVLGDNRNNSLDSRDPKIGPVPEDKLEGKAWLRLYPFSSVRKF